MERKNFYCRVTAKSNPGVCKAFVLSQENEIVQEHYLGFGTTNLAEYIALAFAIKESINSGEYANVITSNVTAFNWFAGKRLNNSMSDNKEAYQINDIIDELFQLNKSLKIGKTKKANEDVYSNVTEKVRLIFRVQRNWLSFYRLKELSID